MNQRGFATLEVILMVMVIAILASIAVPRFTAVTTAANTAKIQADLSTIDTAIAVYIMENGTPATAPAIADIKKYLQDGDKLKPPTGKCYINGVIAGVPTGDYTIATKDGTGTDKDDYRAKLGEYTAGDFTTKKTS